MIYLALKHSDLYLRLLLVAFLPFLILGCGGTRHTSSYSKQNNTSTQQEIDTLDFIPEFEVVEEEEFIGPNIPPPIPPTVYAPRLRRATTPAPPLPLAKNQCFKAVEVRNYEGEDGCGIMLETDDGSLFTLGAEPRGDPIEAGTRIYIGFEYMNKNGDPNCENADAVIRITCRKLLRVSSGVPRPIHCEAYEKPSQWLHDLAEGYSATYITRFPWKEGRHVYLLETPYGQYLYDCRGYLICRPRKNCLGYIENFRTGVVIWEGS